MRRGLETSGRRWCESAVCVGEVEDNKHPIVPLHAEISLHVKCLYLIKINTSRLRHFFGRLGLTLTREVERRFGPSHK